MDDRTVKVAAVVPAYNEAERISVVIDALKEAKRIDEVVVVCDGSIDGTFELVSKDKNINSVKLAVNVGKGGAMTAGAQATDADYLLFLDADLIGMDGEKIDSIVEPVIANSADMSIGLFKDGRRQTDLAQKIAPYISGQRAMKREVFLSIPKLEQVRSGVEIAITKFAKAHGMRVEEIELAGCTHVMKEEKMGFFRGFFSRMKMYYDIGKIMLDGHELR